MNNNILLVLIAGAIALLFSFLKTNPIGLRGLWVVHKLRNSAGAPERISTWSGLSQKTSCPSLFLPQKLVKNLVQVIGLLKLVA